MLALLKGLLIFLSILAAPESSSAQDKKLTINFTVHHMDSNEILYRGTERITINESKYFKLNKYYDPTGKVVLEEETIYATSDLKLHLYRYHNMQNDEKTFAQLEGNTLKVQYQKSPKDELQKGTIEWTPSSIHGKTFLEFIVKNWTTVSAGKDLNFALAIPYRFDHINFRIRQTKVVESKDSPPLHYLALEPQNFFLRTVAPKISFIFSGGQQPKVKSFFGPTGLLVDGKQEETVRVDFQY